MPENPFSEHEMIEAHCNEQESQQPIHDTGTSLTGTSAPLLSNPSLPDVLSNFPIWPQLDQPRTHDPDATTLMDSRNLPTTSKSTPGHTSSATVQEEKTSVGRPPTSTTVRKNKTVQNRRRSMRKRGHPRGRPPNKTPIPVHETALVTSNSAMSDPSAHVTTDQESSAPPINPRYELRRNRATLSLCNMWIA